MKKFTLFSGSDCHLCDLAKQLLANKALPQITVQEINVKQVREYYHQYGARIPVLKNEQTGDELGWPFDAEQLHQFISL